MSSLRLAEKLSKEEAKKRKSSKISSSTSQGQASSSQELSPSHRVASFGNGRPDVKVIITQNQKVRKRRKKKANKLSSFNQCGKSSSFNQSGKSSTNVSQTVHPPVAKKQVSHATRVSLSPRVLKDVSNLRNTQVESSSDSFEALAISKRSNNVSLSLSSLPSNLNSTSSTTGLSDDDWNTILEGCIDTPSNEDTATLSSSSTLSTTQPPTTPSSSDTFDKEVWNIVMEAKKAIHEQESNEPFNPQDHELLPSNLSQSDDNPQLSPPSEPSLPENGGCLVASFDDGRPSVNVSISFNKIQPSTLVATFNNGRPPMNVSVTFNSTSTAANTTSSSIMSCTLSDALEATDEEVNISDKLKELRGKMQLRLKPAQMKNAPKVLDVTSNIIRIADGFTFTNLSEDQQMLVGYNQSAEPPSSVYEHPEVEHPVNVEYTLRTDTLKKVFKDANLKTLDGEDFLSILNLWSFPYDAIDPTTGQLVMNLMHYETEQEHRSLNGKHAFRARHSTGELISTTPAFICANLGNKNFLQTINGDVIPFAFKKDTKPTDKVSEKTYFFAMKAYFHYLLRPAADDKRIVMAIGSKATGKTFAKFAYGGLPQLFAVYDIDPTLWISASDDKLEFNNHCEALYNILYSIYMHLKAMTNDAFATNTRKVIENNPNAEPCTFAMEYFEEGSAIFELIQRNFLANCSLGGANCCEKRDESVLNYLLLLEEKVTPKEALEYIKAAFSAEHRSLVVGWLKFCKMIELAGRLQREEEIDTDDVNEFASLVGMKVGDLMKNAEASMEGRADGRAKSQAKLTIMSQLSAMLKRGNVGDDLVDEMAARCGMKKDNLLEKAEKINKGRADGQAKGLATTIKKGRVSWDDMFRQLVEFKKLKGHCNVPARYDANPQLGEWVQTQRSRKLYKKEKKNKTDNERIEKLNNINFIWDFKQYQWDLKYNELKQYKSRHGNCRVPVNYDANPQLGLWVANQRDSKHLTKERRTRLTDLGFVWKVGKGRRPGS